jgi:ankyrin repeat protein
LAEFLNTATDALGASALHIAAQYGSYEILDMLLDQEGLEIDGQEKRDGDTALHKAVRFVNGLDRQEWDDVGTPVVEILLDAGCDARSRNKAKLKAVDLVDPRNEVLRGVLRKAEMLEMAKGDIVEEDDDEGGDGPASDSD